jgi:hypothetical protein
MTTELISHLKATSLTADTEYLVAAGGEFVFTLYGDGTWQFWDGGAWVDFADSPNFVGYAPPSGRINVNVNSGTVIATFIGR